MELLWKFNNNDIQRVQDFMGMHRENRFVINRYKRNVERKDAKVDKDTFLRTMLIGLLTSQQRSGPDTRVGKFLSKRPFPITYDQINNHDNPRQLVQEVLVENDLTRFLNTITERFVSNFKNHESSGWSFFNDMKKRLTPDADRDTEREIADIIDDDKELFLGFGPKQARNFLQALGLTRYEIPLDSRIMNWFNEFGFPLHLSAGPLQDKGYYHFVSDGIQALCEKADIFPCMLDAAIFASYDGDGWSNKEIAF